jgi:hypothetical protein
VSEDENLTPEERTEAFKKQTWDTHNNLVKKFKEQEEEVHQDYDGLPVGQEIEKLEKDELKKIEKVIKRHLNDWEDIAGVGATNAKLCFDKA